MKSSARNSVWVSPVDIRNPSDYDIKQEAIKEIRIALSNRECGHTRGTTMFSGESLHLSDESHIHSCKS